MGSPPPCKRGASNIIVVLATGLLALLSLPGCLEQIQSPRIPSGTLSNFLLHLENGELDDARAYFAPGLVTPSVALDESIKEASARLRRYDIEKQKSSAVDSGNGEIRETISGRVRPRTPAGQPTPSPGVAWQNTGIITALLVMRGPGWRILSFQLQCCGQ